MTTPHTIEAIDELGHQIITALDETADELGSEDERHAGLIEAINITDHIWGRYANQLETQEAA